MSFSELITSVSGIVALVSAIAAAVQFFSKNAKNKQEMIKAGIIATLSITIISGSIALTTGLARPVVAVNHQTGISLPGRPAPTEGNYNTVVVVTQPPTPATITKTYDENHRTFTCISNCSKVMIVLNKVVVDSTHQSMAWYFTVTNNDTTACSPFSVGAYLEDPGGVKTNADMPGTLTEYNPLNVGESQDRYTTCAIAPKPDVTYTLVISPVCSYSTSTYQDETFTFK